MKKLETGIIAIKDLLALDGLTIPGYQRPYKWTVKNVSHLFNDVLEAMGKGDSTSYRIGTVILHQEQRDGQDILNIVDGQQRLVTLSILFYVMDPTYPLKEFQFTSKISEENIMRNYVKLQELWAQLDKEKRSKYRTYLKEKCEFVKIVTNDLSEAFQFFDSQNSRGKALEPHDLLKAYHLREAKSEESVLESERLALMEQWEAIPEAKLKSLFENYLYPIKQWAKLKDGLYFDASKIDAFKGISQNSKHPFASYFCSMDLQKYQLDQPIVAGTYFFRWVLHYWDLKNLVRADKILTNQNGLSRQGAGTRYTKEMLICALMLLFDRFGQEEYRQQIPSFFKWALTLREEQKRVYRESVNLYALGQKGHSPLFAQISEAMHPSDWTTSF
jgi:hypothetical protein